MTVAMLDHASEQASAGMLPALRILVLARVACEDGATRAELARDLSFAVQPGSQRHAPEAELAKLVRAALVTENRSRFRAADAGLAVLSAELSCKQLPRNWTEMRDIRLVARALGIERDSAARLKALSKPDALRAEVLGATYGFRLKGAASASRLRSELAMVALERAFGSKLKSGISPRTGFNPKTSRLLAGQLLKVPRDAGTDSRLVAALAAETLGIDKLDGEALRNAVLARFALPGRKSPPPVQPAAKPARESAAPAKPNVANRPGMDGFVAAVQAAAKAHAEGWPGNRKAFVSRVWQAISDKHPSWGLSAIEFKAMLAEAHRTGHLVLATADLKDKRHLRELQDSAIAYKNSVFHLVRVED